MKNKKLSIKPFLSVPDIARMMNYTSAGARKFLFKLNLPIHLVGCRYIVYLSDLQTFTPDFYASLLEANNLNYIIEQNKHQELNQDYFEQNCKSQFYSYTQ